MNTSDFLEIPCEGTFDEVVTRVDAFLASHQLKVFARIDQAAEARAVGLDLRPTLLVLFGNPAAGTPLMVRHPSLALDLPLRVVVSQSEDGPVALLFDTPEYFQHRHALDAAPFAPVIAGLRAVAQAPV